MYLRAETRLVVHGGHVEVGLPVGARLAPRKVARCCGEEQATVGGYAVVVEDRREVASGAAGELVGLVREREVEAGFGAGDGIGHAPR